MKISATDPDVGSNAQITYSLHGPGAEEFRLGPHTGESRAKDAFILFPTHSQEWLNSYLLLSKQKDCSFQVSQARMEWQTGRFIAV